MRSFHSIITGYGSYIPEEVISNADFIKNKFYNASGERLEKPTEDIIEKFQQITEIEKRRHVGDNLVTSDIGFFAAREALAFGDTDKETLDYIIVAHNFGDVVSVGSAPILVPSIAAKIKFKLGIKNPDTVAYDILFGCPGWLQALIQADYFIKSGRAKKILVVGAEVLSRVSDPHDIDSMIYSDGAGAVVVEAVRGRKQVGILYHKTRSDTFKHSQLLKIGLSYNPLYSNQANFLKMDGKKLYEYALNHVPEAIQECIDHCGLKITDIKKILIHQANAKMLNSILSRLYKLYGKKLSPLDIMPLTISNLGNSSVATLPTLFDLLMKGELKTDPLKKGDHVVFASVGAGMNINAMIYKMP
ncbi:MAG: ketoacyl-ACP synthase III [Bacteroidota bacterium]